MPHIQRYNKAMAKRKSSKKSASKKKLEKKSGFNSELVPEIIAILLVLVAILLVVAFFGAGGALSAGLLRGLRLVMGLAAYLLPFLLVYIAWQLFQKNEDSSFGGFSYLGLALIILAAAGLFHVGISSSEALSVARSGGGGGFLGYVEHQALLALFNVFTSTIVLIAVGLIGIILAANVKLSELISGLFKREENEDLASQLAKQDGSPGKLTISAKVPLETGGGSSESNSPKEDAVVLTASADPDWKLPPLDILEEKQGKADAGKPEENAEIIHSTLSSFGIEATMQEVNIGPTVTQYTLKPASGVRLSKISELASNLELSLAAHPIRIEAPIPGKSAVGLEVPNHKAATVRLKPILQSSEWGSRKSPLSFVLGRDIAGQAIVADLISMPHLLIAGATGSGKSVMINTFLLSLLYRNSPADLKLILVDPKRVELSLYEDIPHLLAPVIVEPEKCISALKWATAEMERRYSVFAEQHKRNIAEYNTANKNETMPYIVVVIDELADLMSLAANDVESLIVRLAQKARATGIHLVLATQRPSVNVITGLIKANVPARIAFSTVSQVDSRTIIDQAGAEKLLGKGDMLFLAPDFVKSRRIQGVLIDEKEVKGVTDFLRNAREPQYNEEVLSQDVRLGGGKGSFGAVDDVDDSLFLDAAQLVIESRKASASLLQRRLRVGYARAARLLDMLEERGIVSAPDGSRPRDVLATSMSEVMGEDAEPQT